MHFFDLWIGESEMYFLIYGLVNLEHIFLTYGLVDSKCLFGLMNWWIQNAFFNLFDFGFQ